MYFIDYHSAWVYRMFLSWLDWSYGFWGVNITEVKCLSHALTGLITDGVNLDRLARELFARFLPNRIAFSSILSSAVRRKSLSPAHTQGEGMELSSTSWSGKCLHNIVWNSSIRKICLSPPCLVMYSIICIVPFVLTEIRFILWVIIQYYQNCLFCCSSCSGLGYWELFQVAS